MNYEIIIVIKELINGDFCKFLEELYSITSTSASIEHIFSLFGLIWTKLYNKLSYDTENKKYIVF